MKTVDIKAELREGKGKSAVRAMRKTGLLPVVLYGEGKPPLTLSLDLRSVQRAISTSAGEHTILSLTVENSGEPLQLAMFKEIQHATISREILHADLLRISLDKKVQVGIAIELLNVESVKKSGGIVQQNMIEISVECFPDRIPEHITIDLEKCEIGDSIFIRDVHVDPEITVLEDEDEVVVSIVVPAKLEEKVPVPEEAVAAAEEEKVEKEEEKEGEEK